MKRSGYELEINPFVARHKYFFRDNSGKHYYLELNLGKYEIFDALYLDIQPHSDDFKNLIHLQSEELTRQIIDNILSLGDDSQAVIEYVLTLCQSAKPKPPAKLVKVKQAGSFYTSKKINLIKNYNKSQNSLNQQNYKMHQALIKANSIIKTAILKDPISTLEVIQNIDDLVNDTLDDVETLQNQYDLFEFHNTQEAFRVEC